MAFFKPGEDIPLYGTVPFADGTYLKPSQGSLKIFSETSNIPLVRLDCKSHHGMPENHLQFGSNAYTGRYGEEAKDIFSHIVLKKLGVDLRK